jgi:hypothetical protein
MNDLKIIESHPDITKFFINNKCVDIYPITQKVVIILAEFSIQMIPREK